MKKNVPRMFLIIMISAAVLLFVFNTVHRSGTGQTVDRTQKTAQKILYWTCGMHPQVKQDKPGKCPICQMPLIPAYPEEKSDQPQKTETKAVAKILYYRNPMHPEITSPSPMKDEMGMDYIPVYEEVSREKTDEQGEVSRVHLTQNQVNLAGVVVEPISRRRLSKEIRTVGRIAFDPELTVAQEEFITALETKEKVRQSSDPEVIARADDLAAKSKFRLRLLGMSEEEIAQLAKDMAAQLNLVLPEDNAWVYADIYEYDLAWVKQGQSAEIMVTAYPGEIFNGIIKSLSPVLDPETRSAKIRLEINNPGKKLKPEMYVDVIIKSVYKDRQGQEEVLAVPRDAVLDTGLRKIVYVDDGKGMFIGKEVQVGPESKATVNGPKQVFYPVISGLKGDEKVVTKGNFLIDSQSQLSGGMSVLWGGSQEIKSDETPEAIAPAPTQTQHRH